MYFQYDQNDIDYLKKKDAKLAIAIDRIGPIQRPVQDDLYASLVNSIVGQQISTAAHRTIWTRMTDHYGTLTPEKICSTALEDLQRFGISFRKASYILENSNKICSGEFDLEGLTEKSDEEVIQALSSLKGIGVWTAEMLMLFCMQRPDIVSYGDLAILRGMRMLYRHRTMDRKRFDKYRRRYSPKGSVASLYLWAIASGMFPEWSDPAARKKK
ncbi:MAG TPA: DNA-3-methyladenine glycosylase 2 family protein [Clostridiales bacterium]|nr:DNA-3-methyladenine glycosylase 2 family protein [Clostridiales bacterium]